MTDFTLSRFNRETWLAEKLGIFDLNDGITTAEQRRERVRRAIIDGGVADAECFKKNGVVQDYRSAFCNAYGTQLDTDELNFPDSADSR